MIRRKSLGHATPGERHSMVRRIILLSRSITNGEASNLLPSAFSKEAGSGEFSTNEGCQSCRWRRITSRFMEIFLSGSDAESKPFKTPSWVSLTSESSKVCWSSYHSGMSAWIFRRSQSLKCCNGPSASPARFRARPDQGKPGGDSPRNHFILENAPDILPRT